MRGGIRGVEKDKGKVRIGKERRGEEMRKGDVKRKEIGGNKKREGRKEE